MKYFLARYLILDGEHEHRGAVIFEAETAEEASKMADAEEYQPETDKATFYFSFGGDRTTVCKLRTFREISKEQMEFLEREGLVYRK